jgi:hypothetical protein
MNSKTRLILEVIEKDEFLAEKEEDRAQREEQYLDAMEYFEKYSDEEYAEMIDRSREDHE